jgi:hypothetical protein
VWALARRYEFGWSGAEPADDDAGRGGVATKRAITLLPVWVTVVVVVVAVAVALGSVIDVVRVGDAGSKAVWGGVP